MFKIKCSIVGAHTHTTLQYSTERVALLIDLNNMQLFILSKIFFTQLKQGSIHWNKAAEYFNEQFKNVILKRQN